MLNTPQDGKKPPQFAFAKLSPLQAEGPSCCADDACSAQKPEPEIADNGSRYSWHVRGWTARPAPAK